VWIGGALLAVAVLVVVVLSGRQSSEVPFDIDSSRPAGYRALATLVRDRGATVSSISARSLLDDDQPPTGAGEVLVVPRPDLMGEREFDSVMDAARGGALVVLGERRTVVSDDGAGEQPFGAFAGAGVFPDRILADTPAAPTRQGDCEIARLVGLGPIDTAFASPLPAVGEPPGTGSGSEARTCYGDLSGSYVTEQQVGSGSLVTLGSPYLWVNSRLWPDKENGGEPLDNAAMGLRLLGPSADGASVGTRITFVDAVASPGTMPNGTQSPMELIPVGVKLGLVQMLAAFGIYSWWRARRLGSVMAESMPVEIAGSELVVAVGDLLRRKGSPQRAADVLRADARRELARRLGVPPDAPPAAVVSVVAGRSNRSPDELRGALADAPVTGADQLVRLAATLSDIRQEVLENVVR